MAMATKPKIIIEGVTNAGRQFRPSDWAERISGSLATFSADHRVIYSPYVRPTVVGGVKALEVDPELKKADSMAYAFLMSFARDNDLRIVDQSEEGAAPSAAASNNKPAAPN